ncbi:MAG: ATP-binding cassette domain-containing protein [Proteobacteria bacterium]|nr:ATP-binding cassette domain-containing protein [Pseudomonadota bacterium]
MATVRMENVSKRFTPSQQYCNVDDLSFDVKDGEFFCFVGPTNSGKTTTLRLIAGLEKPDSGRVLIDQREVNEVHPNQRQVAMLFETLALYPNKSGRDNIASPLKVKKVPKEDIQKRVTDVANLLNIEHILHRNPDTFSGGEKQRVALARVLVQNPQAFLLDEPLGGLDARLRIAMRSELKRIQRDMGKTLIFVTHDQEEAMSLGNRIGVLMEGRIQQIGTPQELYNHPVNFYVAKTIGKPAMNFFECALERKNGQVFVVHDRFNLDVTEPLQKSSTSPQENEVILGIRPEYIEISNGKQTDQDIAATVFISEPLGSKAIVDFKLGEETIRTLVPADNQPQIKEKKWLQFRKDRIHLFEKVSQKTIF